MAGNGTATFSSPDDYQAGIGGASSKGASVNLIVTGGGDFRARLTWLNLHGLRLLRGSENLPSVAYVALPPERVVVLFPTSTAPLIWGGLELRFGDIVFHSRGERTHQWTPGREQMGPYIVAARATRGLRPRLNRPENNRAAVSPGPEAAASRRRHAAAPACTSLPSCRKAA